MTFRGQRGENRGDSVARKHDSLRRECGTRLPERMPTPFEINPTLCFTLLGTFIIYLWTLPARSARLAVLLLAVGLRAACTGLMGGLGAYYGVWWISWGAFLGIASLIVLAVQVVSSHPSNRRSLVHTFYAGAVFPLCSLLIGYTIPITTWLRPRTYDAFLLVFDGGLGYQLNFALGRFLLHSFTLLGLTTVVYYALPLAACVLYASYRLRERQPVAILALFLSLMVVGYVQYGFFPAVGPVYAFPQWYPLHPPALAQIAILPITVGSAARNCMPSLHLAAALVVWWNSRIWPWWGRLLAFLFLLATIFSTLALGEHYLADLVVAVPFTLAFQAGWTRSVAFASPARRRPLWLGAGLTVAWMVGLRYFLAVFLISPVISWGLILLTLVGCMVLEKSLSAAAVAGDRKPVQTAIAG
jgi:PAP2 superfamily